MVDLILLQVEEVIPQVEVIRLLQVVVPHFQEVEEVLEVEEQAVVGNYFPFFASY